MLSRIAAGNVAVIINNGGRRCDVVVVVVVICIVYVVINDGIVQNAIDDARNCRVSRQRHPIFHITCDSMPTRRVATRVSVQWIHHARRFLPRRRCERPNVWRLWLHASIYAHIQLNQTFQYVKPQTRALEANIKRARASAGQPFGEGFTTALIFARTTFLPARRRAHRRPRTPHATHHEQCLNSPLRATPATRTARAAKKTTSSWGSGVCKSPSRGTPWACRASLA